LWLDYPGDAQAAQQDQEWLLGPGVLVAPVVTQGATSRSVYFPRGCWQRPDTGAIYRGPSSAIVPVALSQLPYFFACGTEPFITPPSAGGCTGPGGRLRGSSLGPVRLGETRRAVRRKFQQFRTRGRRYMDFFCPAHEGIRVGYPSPKLLRHVPKRRRRGLSGRAVLVLTANPRFVLDGVRPGRRLRAVRARLRHDHRYYVGRNTWYLIPGPGRAGVLKVHRGVIGEVGIANRRLTATRPAARRFLRSFE
ncbi:MAG: hypothetical protein WAK93_12150, partial [Solirubrobacteraceae bacterium]